MGTDSDNVDLPAGGALRDDYRDLRGADIQADDYVWFICHSETPPILQFTAELPGIQSANRPPTSSNLKQGFNQFNPLSPEETFIGRFVVKENLRAAYSIIA